MVFSSARESSHLIVILISHLGLFHIISIVVFSILYQFVVSRVVFSTIVAVLGWLASVDVVVVLQVQGPDFGGEHSLWRITLNTRNFP